MQHGNWAPLSKAAIKELPHDRKYTRLEALFCLQVDYDNCQAVTVAGYSALWRWSRKRVYKFLEDMGIKIIYPKNTKKLRNQKGHIAIHKRDIKRKNKGHIRLIDSKWLGEGKNIKEESKGHKRDIKGSTTNDPNPNLIIYTHYLNVIQPERKSKTRTMNNLKKIKLPNSELTKSIDNYATVCLKNEPNFRKDPANFFGRDKVYIDYLPKNFKPADNDYTPKALNLQEIKEQNNHVG